MHPILLVPFLAAVITAAPQEWTTSCEGSSPELERLTEAAEQGDIAAVQAHLDNGADVDAMWRDKRSPMLCQSLLLRSIFKNQQKMFQWLLDRGADPLKIPKDAVNIPIRNGNVEMARTLWTRGLKPANLRDVVITGPGSVREIVETALESKSLAMLELLMSFGVSINASTVPAYYLTDNVALVRFLVPKHIKPNDTIGVGESPCAVQEVFGLIRKDTDGCEGTMAPLWFHFVITGRRQIVEFLIENGADLTLQSEVWDRGSSRPFSAMDVAVHQKDRPMMELLRREGATARLFR